MRKKERERETERRRRERERERERNAGIRIPGVVRVLGCVGVAFGPPTTLDAAGLYALRSGPPRGRVLLPPT